MNCIASSVPGRIRLRHPALRHPDRLARLQRTLADWPQVHDTIANAKAGSLLVHYDAIAWLPDDCARVCQAALAGVLPAHASGSAPPRAAAPAPRRSSAPQVRANRIAKRTMLATLPASLLLAALGAKRWHLWIGVVFLHALGVHLWAHRRGLFR